MLEIDHLEAGYGGKQVLFGVTISVSRGETVAVIGPNGAGKSTLLKAACGLLPTLGGNVRIDGIGSRPLGPTEALDSGVSLLPQGRRVFAPLTVLENLQVGGFRLPTMIRAERLDEVLTMFPSLRSKLGTSAGKLSGGEQQMVAFARALMARPRLLLLDEPLLGLAPLAAGQVLAKVREIRERTAAAVLIVEHRVRAVLGISDRVYGLRLGRVGLAGRAEEVLQDEDGLRRLFL